MAVPVSVTVLPPAATVALDCAAADGVSAVSSVIAEEASSIPTPQSRVPISNVQQ